MHPKTLLHSIHEDFVKGLQDVFKLKDLSLNTQERVIKWDHDPPPSGNFPLDKAGLCSHSPRERLEQLAEADAPSVRQFSSKKIYCLRKELSEKRN
jgi:hypothetical protein